MDVPRHFAESGFIPQTRWFTDEEYTRILDGIVVSCVDCILVHRGRMLIGFRASEPYVGWWVLGGRMLPGESFEDTAQRVTKRETSLHIDDPSRFAYLNTISYVWTKRAQSPRGHGCHMIGNNVMIVLSDEEASAIRKMSDFTALQWIAPNEVLRAGGAEFHEAIHYFAREVAQREGRSA
ncbi:MAG: hypothetical protein G01um1014106_143 [Parcubacteria group bacterium Gr01-1014_106]|nr:MAG: hypothetical protein G01um1014106_143 [Parcubacteria group bacterium Gr01-1014_106]